MKDKYAPIVLFTYNRPQHTQNILDTLSKNEEAKDSILYIYCDGAKPNSDNESLKKIEEVRKIVASEKRFKEIIITTQPENKGLANSIITGVTSVVDKHGTVIVLEDDLVVSPYFLHYMNDSLQRYENDKNVGEIGACNFFACGDKYPKTFFCTMPDTWGWGTWKDRWDCFNPDAIFLYKEIERNSLENKFNTYGAYDMMGMLHEQIFGKVDSWAIRWQAIMVLNNWLCLYPNLSHSNHIESIDATHAKINIAPPLWTEKTEYNTVDAIELVDVIEAMKNGYSGKGDYFGNLKPERKKRNKIFKKILLFFLPYGIVMLFKNRKK